MRFKGKSSYALRVIPDFLQEKPGKVCFHVEGIWYRRVSILVSQPDLGYSTLQIIQVLRLIHRRSYNIKLNHS